MTKKLLVIQARPGIGDLCIFLPFIHKLCEKYKNYEVTLITKKRTRANEILKHDPYIKNILYLSDSNKFRLNLELFNKIRKGKFEKAFIMHYGLRYFILCKLSFVKNIKFYGILKKNESIVGKISYETKKWINDKNIIFEPKIYLEKKPLKKNYICIGIGGSGNNKKWKINFFKELIEKISLNSKNNNTFILAGGVNELNEAQFLIDNLFKNKFISLCELSIEKSLEYLSSSFLYIGNDTSFMHICGSLNIKSFGIFGDTPPDYCSYNKNIIPILPPAEKFITHGSGKMDAILPNYLYENIKDYIQ